MIKGSMINVKKIIGITLALAGAGLIFMPDTIVPILCDNKIIFWSFINRGWVLWNNLREGKIMAKKQTNIILGVVLVAIVILIGSNYLFAITGSETMSRTGPTSVNPGQTFQITYTSIGASGTWGASIEDAVSGGCKFPSGASTYKTVMLSEDGNIKTISITAPQSGSCTFSGNYQFGTFPVKNLNSYTVSVCTPTCTRPSNLCLATSSDGCGGTCTWTVTKLNSLDTNCDNQISRSELGVGITGWVAGTVSRIELGQAIQSWAAS